MKRHLLFTLALALLVGNSLLAASKTQSEKKEPQKKEAPKQTATTGNNAQPDGDQVFQTHCVRCHMPPMSISPRTTGTVIMHMRARARLSREDELLLLKYMAP